MPPGIKSLLGLGLNYCIQTPKPSNELDKTIEQFKTDVRRVSFFMHNPPEENEKDADKITYIPELYIKGTWEPPKSVDPDVEKCIESFEHDLHLQQSRYNMYQDLPTYNQDNGSYLRP